MPHVFSPNASHCLSAMPETSVLDEVEELRGQRRLATWSLALIVAFSTFDIIEDRLEGAPLGHIAFEIFLSVTGLTCLAFIWLRSIRSLKKHTASLRSSLSHAQAEAVRWRSEAKEVLAGLSDAIDRQFKRWALTEAESDIARLLLKGLSNKEIADLRSTSEKTVRQQAAAIYAKADLEGRAQLSAFFLEDLLAPRDETK